MEEYQEIKKGPKKKKPVRFYFLFVSIAFISMNFLNKLDCSGQSVGIGLGSSGLGCSLEGLFYIFLFLFCFLICFILSFFINGYFKIQFLSRFVSPFLTIIIFILVALTEDTLRKKTFGFIYKKYNLESKPKHRRKNISYPKKDNLHSTVKKINIVKNPHAEKTFKSCDEFKPGDHIYAYHSHQKKTGVIRSVDGCIAMIEFYGLWGGVYKITLNRSIVKQSFEEN